MPGRQNSPDRRNCGHKYRSPIGKTLAINLHVLRTRTPGHGDDGWVQFRVYALPIINGDFTPHVFWNVGEARIISVLRVVRIKRTGEQYIRRQLLQYFGPSVELMHTGLPAVVAKSLATAWATLTPDFRIICPATVHRVYTKHFEITFADEFSYSANMLTRQLISGPAIITPSFPLAVITQSQF